MAQEHNDVHDSHHYTLVREPQSTGYESPTKVLQKID